MERKNYNIAVIPGDGIGKEVVPESLRVLEAAAKKYNFTLHFDTKDWSCERYKARGAMMPENGLDEISNHDAILLGAVGFPGVPDHISLWGLLIPIRRAFKQYVNLRPVRLFRGMKCPLVGKEPGSIDFWIIRENNEGEYSEIGGKLYAGTAQEMVMQQSIFTRAGTDRIIRYAFEFAIKHSRLSPIESSRTIPRWTYSGRSIKLVSREV